MNVTAIKERALPAGGSGYAATVQSGAEMRAVENEDISECLIRFDNGAIGALGASRIGTGRKIGLSYRITSKISFLVLDKQKTLCYYPRYLPA